MLVNWQAKNTETFALRHSSYASSFREDLLAEAERIKGRDLPKSNYSAPTLFNLRPAVEVVYGLNFCGVHGPEVRIAALEEAREDATWYLEGLDNLHVPGQSSAIQRALDVALEHVRAESPGGTEYHPALQRAYPASLVPERVASQVHNAIAEEGLGPPSVHDLLLNTLATLHRCMRIAFENEEDWLVEVLEEEREGIAAQAAVALEHLEREARERSGDKQH